MNNRLYIEGLPPSITEASLKALFSQKGNVTGIKLVLDTTTNRPNGRAFVTMETPEFAKAALTTLHGHLLDGRRLVVAEARPIETPTHGLIGNGFETGISGGGSNGNVPEKRRPKKNRARGGKNRRNSFVRR